MTASGGRGAAASEQVLFEREAQEVYAGVTCRACGEQPLCFRVCCWPPSDWIQAVGGNALCHRCLAALDPDHYHTYDRCTGCGQRKAKR